jgi:hypothetical protein
MHERMIYCFTIIFGFFLYCLVQTCNSFHKCITIKKKKDCFVLLIQYFKENVQIFIQVSKFKNWCKMVLVLSRIYTRHQLFLVFPVSHLSFYRHLASIVCPSYVVNFHLKIFSSETTEPHLAGMVF